MKWKRSDEDFDTEFIKASFIVIPQPNWDNLASHYSAGRKHYCRTDMHFINP